MLLTNGLLSNEVLVWKSIGAAVWLAAITVAASAAWSLTLAPTSLLSPLSLLGSLFSMSAWISALALALAQGPAFAAQAAALCSREPRPAHAHRLLLRCPAAAAPAAMLLAKLAARAGSTAGAARTAAFLGLHTLSAALFLPIHSASRSAPAQGAAWTLQYAAWLAGLYLLHWTYWSQDVLVFPSVQRHRYFRIKQRLPGAAAQAAQLTAAAFAGAAATALLRGGGAAGWPLTLGDAAGALLGGSLCAFCWLMGSGSLEVVFTERLRPDDYSDRDVLAAMLACLGGKKGGLMQGLALHDASLLACDVGQAAGRRAEIFSDEFGDRWRPVAAACIGELDALSAAVAEALPQQKLTSLGGGGAGAGAAPSGATQSHKWNVLPSALSTKGGLGGSRQQLGAVLAVRCGYPRAALAAQALAGFAAASLREDRFGILQLNQPGLGDVLLCLLGTLGATQQLLRSIASLAPRQLSLGPWRGNSDSAASASCYSTQSLDAAAYALQDSLTVALYRITAAFGDGLLKVLADSRGTPAYGTTTEASALLQQFIKGQA